MSIPEPLFAAKRLAIENTYSPLPGILCEREVCTPPWLTTGKIWLRAGLSRSEMSTTSTPGLVVGSVPGSAVSGSTLGAKVRLCWAMNAVLPSAERSTNAPQLLAIAAPSHCVLRYHDLNFGLAGFDTSNSRRPPSGQMTA